MTIDIIAEEFMQKYGISEERSDYLMNVASMRLLFKHPFKYLFREEQRVKESYQLINRYLGMEKSRNDKMERVHTNYERNHNREVGNQVIG